MPHQTFKYNIKGLTAEDLFQVSGQVGEWMSRQTKKLTLLKMNDANAAASLGLRAEAWAALKELEFFADYGEEFPNPKFEGQEVSNFCF